MNKAIVRFNVALLAFVVLVSYVLASSQIAYGLTSGSKVSLSGFNDSAKTYSWDSSQNAFVCHDDSYGNYLRECSATSYGRIGTALPESEDFASSAASSDMTVSYDLAKNSGESQVGLRINNLLYSHPTKGDIYIDSEIVVTGYADGPDTRKEKRESVSFLKCSRPVLWTSGVYALWITQRFYYGGTTTPITVKSNTTILDLDDYQGVVIKDSRGYTGVGSGTYLSYNSSYNGFPAYYGDRASVTNEPMKETAVAHNFEGSTVNYLFFDNSPSTASAGGSAVNEETPEETGVKLEKQWHDYSSYDNWIKGEQNGNPYSYCGPKNFIGTREESRYVNGDGVTVIEKRNIYDARYRRLVTSNYTYAWLRYEHRYYVKKRDSREENRWDNIAKFSARATYVPKNNPPYVYDMAKSPSYQSYEGDYVTVEAKFKDNDADDKITSWYELRRDGALIENGPEEAYGKNTGSRSFVSPSRSGDYQVTWFVRDQRGAIGRAVFNYSILPRSGGGVDPPNPPPDPPNPPVEPVDPPVATDEVIDLYHTSMWEEKRNKFNQFYYGRTTNDKTNLGYVDLWKRPRLRYKNVYWSGERILIDFISNKRILSARARLVDPRGNYVYSGGSIVETYLTMEDDYRYSGYIWEEGFVGMTAIGTPALLNVEVRAQYEGGKETTSRANLFMDDYRFYSESHMNK